MLSTEQIKTGPGEFHLARMTEHDLIEVVEIEEKTGLSRWGWEAYHAELLRDNGSLMLVARLNHQTNSASAWRVAGFVAARMAGDELHINNIAVRPAYRRRGIGDNLLDAALKEAARLGCHVAVLEVRLSNEAAQKLYEKHGFHLVSRRRNYYTQPPEDALVMQALL
ncbi:MAG TPA: ribosomal protein S18-alanine N-acetyltransferase [Pyrinomonadaceae bacterium]|jgi:ribosomal-protein-alanine N-acetyltransferase